MQELDKPQVKKKNVKNTIYIVIQAIIILICLVGAIFIIIKDKGHSNDPTKMNSSFKIILTDSMTPTLEVNTMIFTRKVEKDEILDIGSVVTYYIEDGKDDKGNTLYATITHRIVGYYYYNGVLNTNFKVYGNKDLHAFSDLDNKYSHNVKFIGYLVRGDKKTFEKGASLNDFNIINADESINYNEDDKFYSYLTNEMILAVWTGNESKFLGKVVAYISTHTLLCIVLPVILLILYNMFLVVKEIINDKKEKAKEDKLKELDEKKKLTEEEIKKKAIEEYLASLNKEDDSGGEEPQEEN